MIDPEGAEEMAIEIMVDQNTFDGDYDYNTVNYNQSDANSLVSSYQSAGILTSTNSKSEDKEELKALRQEIDRLRHINKKLFEVSSKQLLRQKRK